MSPSLKIVKQSFIAQIYCREATRIGFERKINSITLCRAFFDNIFPQKSVWLQMFEEIVITSCLFNFREFI